MSNMNFEEFKQAIVDGIKEYLPEEYADSAVRINQVTKNNDIVLDAITVTSPESNVSPTIYLNDFFNQYENGRPLEEIMTQIAELQVAHAVNQEMDVSKITDYEQVKDKIAARLVGTENNKELLSQRPHTMVDDLAVTYCVMLGEDKNGSMSVPITYALKEQYGVSVEELHQAALNNMSELTPATFKGMNEVMAEMMLPNLINECGGDREQAEAMLETMIPPVDSMYVLSNEQKINGAAVVLDDKLMDQVAERVGNEFYILPSSIHELLVIPKDTGMAREDLENMVQEVNATQVSPQERLSDHVYAYDAREHELYRADKEAERVATKEASRANEKIVEPKKRESVKAKLADKQKAVDEAKKEAPVKAPIKNRTVGID